MKPPSFLNKQDNRKPMLLSIEVSITPTRSGRVGIKEGDNLQTIARNFCKAYHLDKEMEQNLTSQLKNHLDNYYRQIQYKAMESALKDKTNRQMKNVARNRNSRLMGLVCKA